MKVALTGSTGFVGRHVLAALAQREGIEVVVASRSARGAGVAMDRMRHIVLDVDAAASDAFEKLERPDVLIHLAWDGLPNYKSLHHIESQLPLQYQFLRGLVHAGLPKLLCTGTCFEYGMQSGSMTESTPAAPANPYGYAKHALHQQLRFLQSTTNFGLTWARLFYLYGDDQAATSLYAQLDAALQKRAESFAMSPGDQLRDYMQIDDAARILVTLALDAPAAGTVNVCSGNPVSVRALIESWIAARGQRIDLKLGAYPYPDHEPLAFWGSAEKLNAVLGAVGEST